MITHIFFDFDGVLTTATNGSLTTFTFLSQKTGIDLEALLSAWKKVGHDAYIGIRKTREVWPDFCRELGMEVDMGLLVPAYESTPLNNDMFALCKDLKTKYTLGVITDNPEDRFYFLKDTMKVFDLFSAVVDSAEARCLKTEKGIFEMALEVTAGRAEQSLFIDNHEHNLVMPREMGFQTYWFDDKKNDVESLKRFIGYENRH